MGTYANLTATITGPNNILLDLKTNVFSNNRHSLYVDDEVVVDGDTLYFSTHWKISWDYHEAFQIGRAHV